ncbi:hypothetical protein HUJ05_003670 [Dendroctonus ponderosae]|nr:hypothetical protein HUJ05_003670 [Dendroctonus ponderosae]
MEEFDAKVKIKDEEVSLRFHVIPTSASSLKAIIGRDVLSQVDVSITNKPHKGAKNDESEVEVGSQELIVQASTKKFQKLDESCRPRNLSKEGEVDI